jgi:hypothetical protein
VHFSGNSASAGGGVYNDHAILTLNDCTVSNNIATAASGEGGGIYNDGRFQGGAALEVNNSTLSGNSAQGYGWGGAIYNDGDSGQATLQIANSTLSSNFARTYGATIYNAGSGAAVSLANSIFKAADLGGNIYNIFGGIVNSFGYNLSDDDGSGFLNGPGDQIDTNPMLGPLQDNGGTTLTQRPSTGSPAIDAGDPNFTAPPLYDQRGPGFDRVVNGRIDIGSFEVQADKPPVRPPPIPRARPVPRPRPTPP